MVQLKQTEKKPRLQHSNLTNSALTPKEKQCEQQKRWLANEKRNPHSAQEMKEQNTANKWAWRKCKREEMQSKQHMPDTNSQGHAPQKRPQTSSPEAPSGHVGPSISEPDTIPIGPILLAQETLTTIVTPCQMCDIAVMTDTPSPPVNCSSIPDDQAYPSPTLSAVTDLEFRDLANPIIGSQVHEQSDTVQWDDGSTTVLPCIMKNGIKICKEDALAVSFFASLPELLPMTSKNISAALRINKAVVIQQVSTPKPATLDLEYLEDHGMSDLMCVILHGFTYPHQNATLAEFIPVISEYSRQWHYQWMESNCHIPYSGPTSDDVPMPSGHLLHAHPDLHTLIHAFSPPVHYRFGSVHLRTSIYPYLRTSAAKAASSTLSPIGSELIPSWTLPSLDYRSISMIHILVSSSPRSPDPLIRYPDALSDISRPPDLTYTHIRSPNLKSASISLW
ncbi:hypothetical protein DFJ58DRAFT_734089 [Suillus subalutaceus]|uniref:uncharacterized protein n=1 Tax=Suillus subalutaceus TaxID=48586 RepID=UPI001B869E06|nr:uncharacterized protein DFJ58DRAFT_734089 [Suillus subalutaceus]KAG1837991.1 hypothetical protein DFJ58DRAFT_734089 [Suillus subalutaceus]